MSNTCPKLLFSCNNDCGETDRLADIVCSQPLGSRLDSPQAFNRMIKSIADGTKREAYSRFHLVFVLVRATFSIGVHGLDPWLLVFKETAEFYNIRSGPMRLVGFAAS